MVLSPIITEYRSPQLALEFKLDRPIKDGMDTLHSCDNRRCVNPFHLSEGTRQENVRDMWMKGRSKPITGHQKWGEQSNLTKHPDALIIKIRELYKSGMSQKNIALLLNVNQPFVSLVVRYKTRKQLESERN